MRMRNKQDRQKDREIARQTDLKLRNKEIQKQGKVNERVAGRMARSRLRRLWAE